MFRFKHSNDQLNSAHLGIAIGLALGSYLWFIGWVAWLTDWGNAFVQIAGTWYLGFEPTFVGGIMGGLWGFADGFIGGVVIAWIYNYLKKRQH